MYLDLYLIHTYLCLLYFLYLRLSTYVKAAVRRFVSTEVHVKASVARRFFWTELCAWPEDLPAGSTILLSGKVGGTCLAASWRLLCAPAAVSVSNDACCSYS